MSGDRLTCMCKRIRIKKSGSGSFTSHILGDWWSDEIRCAVILTSNLEGHLRSKVGLKPYLLDERALIVENDRYGSYRLSIVLENLTYDKQNLLKYWHWTISSLANELQ